MDEQREVPELAGRCQRLNAARRGLRRCRVSPFPRARRAFRCRARRGDRAGARARWRGARERAGDAAGPLAHVRARRLVHVLVGDHVGDGEAAAGAQHARGLGDHPRLVAGEVDDAVGDHDVDARVGQRDLLDVALERTRRCRRRPRPRWRARASSISSVMSRPIALPVGPTRRAEISTSAPAPEPRSSTVSPSCRSATAVGTPQPSEARDSGLRRARRPRRRRRARRRRPRCPSVTSPCAPRALGRSGAARGVALATASRTSLTVGAAGSRRPPSPQHAPLASGSQQVACVSGAQQVSVSSAMWSAPPGRREGRSSRPTAPGARSRRSRPRAAS